MVSVAKPWLICCSNGLTSNNGFWLEFFVRVVLLSALAPSNRIIKRCFMTFVC